MGGNIQINFSLYIYKIWQRLCNGSYISQKLLFVANGHHEAYGLIVQKSCNGGRRFRSRTCTSLEPKNNGRYCVGPDEDDGFCNIESCPG